MPVLWFCLRRCRRAGTDVGHQSALRSRPGCKPPGVFACRMMWCSVCSLSFWDRLRILPWFRPILRRARCLCACGIAGSCWERHGMFRQFWFYLVLSSSRSAVPCSETERAGGCVGRIRQSHLRPNMTHPRLRVFWLSGADGWCHRQCRFWCRSEPVILAIRAGFYFRESSVPFGLKQLVAGCYAPHFSLAGDLIIYRALFFCGWGRPEFYFYRSHVCWVLTCD